MYGSVLNNPTGPFEACKILLLLLQLPNLLLLVCRLLWNSQVSTFGFRGTLQLKAAARSIALCTAHSARTQLSKPELQ